MKNSKNLFKEANKYIPGGVNSPVRAFSSVNSKPFFVKKAKGQYLIDEDNKKYIDYVGSWGAQILGHADNRILKVLEKTMCDGITYGAPCKNEVLLAKKITQTYKSIEKIRMVNSGTEATMSAIRLARGYTGKDKIIKFNGCYHGHGDSFLIKAGSGASTFGTPDSLGVTKANAKNTISLEYNDIEAVNKIVNKGNIASIIIEPIAGNMNFIRSQKKFLQELRKICTKKKIVLIFDEVMTGFRVSMSGAQELYGILPDLTTLGKVLGGGLPVGAFGGKKEIMDCVAPNGEVYQAGTLSGNPLAMSAGLTTLKMLNKNVYSILEEISKKIQVGWEKNIKETDTNACVSRVGSMMTLFFTNQKSIRNYSDALECDTTMYAKYFKLMLDMGVYLPPSQYESLFLSSVMTENDIEKLISSNRKALEILKNE